MRRTALVLALIVCTALLSPSATASADAERRARQVASKVTVAGNELGVAVYRLWGDVDSRVNRCAKRRLVKLTAVETGVLIASTRTNRRGAWRFALGPADVVGLTMPAFTASVARKVVRHSGRRVVCKPGKMVSAFTGVEFTSFDSSAGSDIVIARGGFDDLTLPACFNARHISLRNVTLALNLGNSSSTGTGEWAVPFDFVATGSDASQTYRGTAARKVRQWNGRKLTCHVGSGTVVPEDLPIVMRPTRGLFGR